MKNSWINLKIFKWRKYKYQYEKADKWKLNILPNLIFGYKQKDIFNLDEPGLFYNLLPNKNLHLKGKFAMEGNRLRSS